MAQKYIKINIFCLTILFFSFITIISNAEEIKIGIIVPITGVQAKAGKTQMSGYQFAVDQINARGGIRSLGGAKLKLVIGDSKGDPLYAKKVARQLIENNVVALAGEYFSSVAFTTTEVAEKHHTPYIVTSALSEKITSRGFRYTFRPGPTIRDFVSDEFKFIESFIKKTQNAKPRIALLYEDSWYGQFSAALQRSYARARGLNVVKSVSYSSHIKDLTPFILNLKEAKPDLILQESYLTDSVRIADVFEKNGFRPNIIATGGGPKDPEFIKQAGPLADNWLVVNEWNHNVMKEGVGEINEDFYKKYGTNMDGISAICALSIWVLQNALEKAASIDRESLREAIASTFLKKGFVSSFALGSVKFNDKGQNRFQNLITQIINGKHYTVWPPELAVKDAFLSK